MKISPLSSPLLSSFDRKSCVRLCGTPSHSLPRSVFEKAPLGTLKNFFRFVQAKPDNLWMFRAGTLSRLKRLGLFRSCRWEASSESPWVFGDASRLHDLKRLCLFRRDKVPARNTHKIVRLRLYEPKKVFEGSKGRFFKNAPWQGVGRSPTKTDAAFSVKRGEKGA